MGSLSRRKGASFERAVSKMIIDAFGVTKTDCYRSPCSGGHRFASKADPGDLVMSAALREVFPYDGVECKHYARLPWQDVMMRSVSSTSLFAKWWKQAKAGSGGKPVLVFKQNNGPVFCAALDLCGAPIRVRTRIHGDVVAIGFFEELLNHVATKSSRRPHLSKR